MINFKKIIATCIACTTVIASLATTSFAASKKYGRIGERSVILHFTLKEGFFFVMYGDVNMDNQINIADFVMLTREINWDYGPWLYRHVYEDTNGDGWYDEADAALLYQYIIKA